MIVPMTKVSLLILGDQKTDTLKTLRRLGLMHIEMSEGTSPRLTQLHEQVSLLESSLFAVTDRVKKPAEDVDVPPAEALDIAAAVAAIGEERQALTAERARLQAELERLQPFGEVDPQALAALADKGVPLALYDIPTAVYDTPPEDVTTLRLHRNKTSVGCVVWGTPPADWAAYRVELPSASTAAMRTRAADITARMAALDDSLVAHAVYAGSMRRAIAACGKEIEFETYHSGMTDEDLSAVTVSHFTGYIESERLPQLQQCAQDNAWGLLAAEPTEEDDVPTKLHNNRFVSLIYPLTDFLGTVPGYFEYDISGWFLAFILIFFGIIFGDGGYGLLITAVAAIPIIKSLIKRQAVSPTMLLVGLFGLSTVLWGTLTCTWFGLPAAQLPGWLQSLSIPVISNVYADTVWYPFWTNGAAGLTTAQNLQIFCFTLALIQLTVAHIKGAARNRHSLKMLGDIGSILQLIGIYYIVLSLVVNAQVFSFGLVLGGIPVGTVAIVLIAVGFVMSFVFANYEGSVVKSLLESLKNIVSVLLGVVNVFSDIVSYIRLWAVGLAGAAISATVNELAGPLLGNFLFMILAIVLLVFGHGLNMILNVLSVIVHGIRLNTLEFSSHLDMSWSGHKFKPFEE